MDLFLWRIADAGIAGDGSDDPTRGLTAKGERQAQRMAEWLNRVLPESTRVLVSPALRAQQTAQALGRKFKTTPAIAPDATVGDLLAAVRWPEAREPVMVVGHQPILGLTAAYLMSGLVPVDGVESAVPELSLQPWSMKKGAVWWLRHRPREDRGEVVLMAVRTPELI
jgi:phosphohistidine phosphatase